MTQSLIDLTALGQPATKLIEVVSTAIGVLYEPTRIRRKAKAEADANLILKVNEAELEQLARRAGIRLAHQELRRQENLEEILGEAVEVLQGLDPSDTETIVEEHWILDFFDKCKDVNSEVLQKLWAKILAWEAIHPDGISRSTLAILSRLDPEDAQLFQTFCRYLLETGDMVFLPRAGSISDFLERRGISAHGVRQLMDLGLLQAPTNNQIHLVRNESRTWIYFSQRIHVQATRNANIGVVTLTKAGRQIRHSLNIVPDDIYIDRILSWLASSSGFAHSLRHLGNEKSSGDA
jgi:hypothetical protein